MFGLMGGECGSKGEADSALDILWSKKKTDLGQA